MERITYLSNGLNEFFYSKAEALSISSKFIQRRRKITGMSFIKSMIFGNLGDSESSLENICCYLGEDKIKVTRQGLNFRFTPAAAEFMERMFEVALTLFNNKLALDCKILNQFKGIKLLDSTQISLPSSMENLYRGYGSSYPGHMVTSKAGIKLQVLFDYMNQTIEKIEVKEAIRSDQGYRGHLEHIQADDLLIADLGYFVPSSFRLMEEVGAYYISRYKADTNIYDVDTEEKLELLDLLGNSVFLTKEVLLGKEAKLKVRLVCHKLTKEQSEGRRRKANKLAKSRRYNSSELNQQLLDYAIFITNIPPTKIKSEDIIIIYKLRWQIELLFKLYKTHIKVEVLKGRTKQYRILCELYAKLCIILIFHGITSLISLGKNAEISLTKAYLEFRRRGRELFAALNNIKNVEHFLDALISSCTRFCLKDRKRKRRISTLSLVNSLFQPLT